MEEVHWAFIVIVLGVMPLIVLFTLYRDEERGREIILRLLREQGEMNGRQIVAKSNGFFGVVSVYPLLRKMESEGFLASRDGYREHDDHSLHSPELYRLSGKKVKRNWISYIPYFHP